MEPYRSDSASRSHPPSVIPSGVGGVENLNRFLGALVKETWDDLDRALRITERCPDFSGILPLGDPALQPFFDKPGIFFILGPQPALTLLHVGASRGPVGFVLRSRIEKKREGGFEWRWEQRSDEPPTYAAIASMEEHWAFAPSLRNLLARRLGKTSDFGRRGAEDPSGPQ